MHVTSNRERVLVQMTVEPKGKVKGKGARIATVVPAVTLEAMRRVAETLQVRMSADVERVEVHAEDHRQGFYNFYVFPRQGRQFTDAEVALIGMRTQQVWQTVGLPTT